MTDPYSLALTLLFARNKNTSAIARELDKTQSSISRFLKKVEIGISGFKAAIKVLFGDKPLTIVIDDTVLSKRYSQAIEGTSSMVDQSTKTFTKGVKIVAAGLTDGKFFLPIDLEQWVAQFISQDAYLTKVELAKKLILRILELDISVKDVVLDGLYFSQDFIEFLDAKKLKFVIKAKTTTSVVYKGQKMQLRECKDLRLNSNQNQKIIKALWKGQIWYFVAMRRTGKHGDKISYLIANFLAKKSKVYSRIYASRWTVEKFIRTAKQSLGLNDSCSQIATVYLNHIRCVFMAYGHLQLIMKKKRLKSAEDALRMTHALKLKLPFCKILDQISSLYAYA